MLQIKRSRRSVREIRPSTHCSRTARIDLVDWYVRAPPTHPSLMPEPDPARPEPSEVPSDDPPAEVADAFATLMALAATLDELDLDGVEPVFVPRDLA